MTRFPLRYAHRNILVGRDSYAALYRVRTTSYPYLPAADKRDQLRRLARFAYHANADFSVYRVNRAYPASGYVEQAMSLLDDRYQTANAWTDFLQVHAWHLEDRAIWLPEVYVSVTLPTPDAPNVGASMVRGIDRARRQLEDLMGVRHPVPISARTLDALTAAEDRTARIAMADLHARRASATELQWLIRRAACRGVAEPPLDPHWQPNAVVTENGDGPALEPVEHDLIRLGNMVITEDARAVTVHADEHESHQAFLALGALPEEMIFPGQAELLFTPLEALGFPVDAVIHAEWIGNREAISKVRKRIVDADNAVLDQATARRTAPLSYSLQENPAVARELDAYLGSTERPPLLKASLLFSVGAKTRERLEERVDALRHRYGTVALHRPAGLQPALFMDHLPRPDGGTVRDYAEILTVEQFGALMPTGTHICGTDRGAYFARVITGGSRPVRVDPTDAARRGRAPSILLAGTLGSGKTVAAQTLALIAERRGSLIVDIDPKPDHNLEGIPELAGRVQVIDLHGDERYRGLLDPLRIAESADFAEDLASSYLLGLLKMPPQAWETQIRRAVRQALGEPRPSCHRVLGILSSGTPDARAAAEALEVWADSPLGRLAFSRGEAEQTTVKYPVTTIKGRALTLPDPTVPREAYDTAERLSVQTLKLIAAFAMRLVSGERRTHKLVLFDEAWFLLASPDGRRLISNLNRLGRTENATLILATQQLGDVGPEIDNLIGQRLIFGMETKAEAERALELLGLDPDDQRLVEQVRSFRRGRCLMADVDRRVAEVQVDPVFPDWLRILDTSPGAREETVA